MSISFKSYKNGEGWWPGRTLAFSSFRNFICKLYCKHCEYFSSYHLLTFINGLDYYIEVYNLNVVNCVNPFVFCLRLKSKH